MLPSYSSGCPAIWAPEPIWVVRYSMCSALRIRGTCVRSARLDCTTFFCLLVTFSRSHVFTQSLFRLSLSLQDVSVPPRCLRSCRGSVQLLQVRPHHAQFSRTLSHNLAITGFQLHVPYSSFSPRIPTSSSESPMWPPRIYLLRQIYSTICAPHQLSFSSVLARPRTQSTHASLA